MIRFTKRHSKKGFTLLEVLLATAILVIISSMLMQGFITTMGFSYNSSVYARSAAWNSKLCIAQLGTWSANADKYEYDSVSNTFKKTKTAAYDDTEFKNTSASKKINFGQGTVGSKLGSVSVAIHKETGVAVTASELQGFKTEKLSTGDRKADNRAILFYYPSYNGEGKSYFGNTNVYMLNGKKCWGHDANDGSPRFDRWFDPNSSDTVPSDYTAPDDWTTPATSNE